MPEAQRPAMAEYGVPDDLDGTLPWDWARQRLVPNRNYWVVTVDADHRPHSTPVWGVWVDDDTFWFSCAHTALKARNLRANPHVAVTTADTVEFVSLEGVAVELTPPAEVARAWALKYRDADNGTDASDADDTTEMEAFFSGNAAFQVRPTKVIGMIERPDEFAQRATRWVF